MASRSESRTVPAPPVNVNVHPPDEAFVKPVPNHSQPFDQATAPMLRAPVPDHIRAQLRSPSNACRPRLPASSPSKPPSHSDQAYTYVPDTAAEYLVPQTDQQKAIRHYQAMEQHRSQLPAQGVSQPTTAYGEAFDKLAQTVENQYGEINKAGTIYAQRQAHIAEYGRPPPNIHPPSSSSETTLDPALPTSTSTNQPPYPASIQFPRPVQPASLMMRAQQSQYAGPPLGWQQRPQPLYPPQPRPRGRPRKSSASQLQSSSSQMPGEWTPRSHWDAESAANWVNPSTGINAFGAPKGYMPAEVVSKFKAWDEEGTARWVSCAERERGKMGRTD